MITLENLTQHLPFGHIKPRGVPERGSFFRVQVCERVGILLVELYERVVVVVKRDAKF